MIVARRGLGDFWSSVAGAIGSLFGKSNTVTIPPECVTFDAAAQMQCAQMKTAVNKGQMMPAQYTEWLAQQQQWATIKKYAPYALAGVGIIIVVSMLKGKSS